MNHTFARIANWTGWATGHPLAFIVSLVAIVVWAASGPLFEFSDTWQLVVNTSTTVVTYLLVFIIQNTANRNAAAMQLKLDEILRALPRARTELGLERLEEADEQQLHTERARLERLARGEG